MTLILLGDSHAITLDEGLRRMSQSERAGLGRRILIKMLLTGDEVLIPFCLVGSNRLSFYSSNARHRLESVTGHHYLSEMDRAAVFGFVMGFMTNALLRNEMWGRFIPWNVVHEDNQQVLSDAVIESVALAHNEFVFEFFERVVGIGIRCFAIAAPPISPNEITLAGGSRAELILEIDRIARNAVAKRLATLGIPVVWPPDEAYAAAPRRSLLRADLAFSEYTGPHATADYGRIMLKHLVRQTAGLHPWLLLPTLGNQA